MGAMADGHCFSCRGHRRSRFIEHGRNEVESVWEHLDHIAIILGLGSPLFWTIHKIWKMAETIEGDHAKIAALWREHDYGNWDGTERRKGGIHEVSSM